ncbi:hypothetical protein MAJ_07127, partial [Metarhizium majus ARSEF 297]
MTEQLAGLQKGASGSPPPPPPHSSRPRFANSLFRFLQREPAKLRATGRTTTTGTSPRATRRSALPTTRPEEDTGPEEDTDPEEDTELSKRAEATPPSNGTTTRVEMILDDVPQFLAQLAKTNNQGFVPTAPAKEPDAHKARSIAMRENDEGSAKECLAKLLQNTKQ